MGRCADVTSRDTCSVAPPDAKSFCRRWTDKAKQLSPTMTASWLTFLSKEITVTLVEVEFQLISFPVLLHMHRKRSRYLPHRSWWEVVFAGVGRYIIIIYYYARRQHIQKLYIHSIKTYRYVYEQLPGANSSPIVTKRGQSYRLPQGTRWLNYGRSRSTVKVGGEVCALLSPST